MFSRMALIFIPLLMTFLCSIPALGSSEAVNSTKKGIRLAEWKFYHYEIHFTITVFIILLMITKLVYHKITFISSYVPESCILIILGICFGFIIKTEVIGGSQWRLDSEIFFNYLLPPIILEASYSLFNRNFAGSLGPVLLFAVVGTILNFVIVGGGLWLVSKANIMGLPSINLDFWHCLLFSSLIVAVDPVAVLAIFEDIGVDHTLYFIVFGESLFNDAVTIVIYNVVKKLIGLSSEISFGDVGMGIASFFTVSLGGLLIGVVVGAICAFITRFTTSSRVLEPMIIISMGYFAYIIGDIVSWSGLIAMIGCGLVQAGYAFENISRRSLIVVKRVAKMLSSIADAIIFLFLGIELVMGTLKWHTGFSFWTLALCLFARGLVTLLLTFIVNKAKWGVRTISWTEGFVLVYGGLRGAVAFSLVSLITPGLIVNSPGLSRDELVTTTLFVILFTVVVMGLTMKPIVRLLKIRLQADTKLSLFTEMHLSIASHLMAGMEGVVGNSGHNQLMEKWKKFNQRYICHILQRDPSHDKILKVFEKINMQMHIATTMPSADCSQNLSRIPELLRDRLLHQWQNERIHRQDSHESAIPPAIDNKQRNKWFDLMKKIQTSEEASQLQSRDDHDDQPVNVKQFHDILQFPHEPRLQISRTLEDDLPRLEDDLKRPDFMLQLQATMNAKNAFLRKKRKPASCNGPVENDGTIPGASTSPHETRVKFNVTDEEKNETELSQL